MDNKTITKTVNQFIFIVVGFSGSRAADFQKAKVTILCGMYVYQTLGQMYLYINVQIVMHVMSMEIKKMCLYFEFI